MKHRTTVLLVNNHVIDHHQRLGIDVQGVQTLYEHHVANTGSTITGDAIHLTAQVLLDFVLDIDNIGVGKVVGAIVVEDVNLFLVFSRERGGVQFYLALLFAGLQSHADWVEVRHVDIDRRGKLRHLEPVGSVLLRECAIAVDVVGTDNGTGNRIASGSIDDAATYHSGCVLLLLGL